MTHLKPAEVIDAVDRTLPAERHRHLAACDACRALVEDAGAMAVEVARVDLPEPSPLFWEHLGRRVALAIDGEPVPRGRAWSWWTGRFVAACTVLVVTVTAATWSVRPGRDGGGDGTDPWAVETTGETLEWEFLVRLAGGDGALDRDELPLALDWDVVDGAAEQLSGAERAELARLLRAELERPAS
jgi:hypothetical protein